MCIFLAFTYTLMQTPFKSFGSVRSVCEILGWVRFNCIRPPQHPNYLYCPLVSSQSFCFQMPERANLVQLSLIMIPRIPSLRVKQMLGGLPLKALIYCNFQMCVTFTPTYGYCTLLLADVFSFMYNIMTKDNI